MYAKDRSKEIRKLESEGGGFKPAEFKSSRSFRYKQGEGKASSSNSTQYETSILGPIERPFSMSKTSDIQSAVNILTSSLSEIAESSAVGAKFVNDTVLHDRVNLNWNFFFLKWAFRVNFFFFVAKVFRRSESERPTLEELVGGAESKSRRKASQTERVKSNRWIIFFFSR